MNNSDRRNLRLLAVLHYVLGGLATIVHGNILRLWLLFISNDSDFNDIIIVTVLLSILLIYALCVLISGVCIAKHKHYYFSLVIACISGFYLPLILIGIFTLIILSKRSVRSLYGLL